MRAPLLRVVPFGPTIRDMRLSLAVMMVVLTGAGCTNLRLEREDVQTIRKVAVVGMVVRQTRDRELERSRPSEPFGQQLLRATLQPASRPDAEPSMAVGACAQTARAVYGDLSAMIEKDLGWRLVTPAELRSRGEYARLSQTGESKEDGTGQRLCTSDEIGAPWSFEELSLEERASLLRALGADALVTADVDISWGAWAEWKFSTLLSNAVRPSALVRLKVYKAGKADPVWQDVNTYARSLGSDEYLAERERLIGEREARQATDAAPAPDPLLETRLEALSAHLALQNLLERYRSELGAVASSR